MFFLLYKHIDYGVLDNFPKISDHFPNIYEIVLKARQTFPNISEDVRRVPKIAEDFWWRPEDISMIHQRI